MPDLLTEHTRTLSQAAKHPLLINPRTCRPIDRTQIFRWITDGKRSLDGNRVMLEAIRHPVGRQLVTSDEAIERFVARLNGADIPVAPAPKRRREAELRRPRRQFAKEVVG
jgi:hypothetical protein